MADPKFQITQVGLDAASVATPTGPYINITEFRVGSASGYIPDLIDTALHGTLLHSGVPFSYTILDDETLDILLLMDADVGPFSYGEVGLYLPGGILFALAAFEIPQQKIKGLGNQVASRTKIHALIKLAQAPAIIQVSVTNSQALLELPSWSSLVPPVAQLSGANAAIIHEVDPFGETPMVIRKSDYDWTVLKYHKIADGTINAMTTATVTASVFSDLPLDLTTQKRYLIKFTTSGLIRAINSIAGGIATLASTIAVQAGNFELLESDNYDLEVAWASGKEFNDLVNAYNPTWSTPSGTPQNNRGLNQVAIGTLARVPTLADWTSFTDKVIKGAKLTGTDFADVLNDDYRFKRGDLNFHGLAEKKKRFDALSLCVNSVVANHNSVDPAFLESTTPANSTATKSGTTWVDIATVQHVLTLDYASANVLNATFNGGGSVNLFAVVTTPQNGQEFSWMDFLFANGTIKVRYDTTIATSGLGTAAALGYYDLTGSYQQLWTRTIAAVIGNITYTLEGRKTSATQLQFRVSFINSTVPGPYSGATTAVLTSTGVTVRPASSIILDPVLAYPTASSTGIS